MANKSMLYVGMALITVAPPALAPSAAAAQVGTIEGVVLLEPPPPPRRTANRYAGGPAPAQTVQAVPVVVYLLGAVPGEPSGATGRQARMVQSDSAFAPAAVAVRVGGTVEFPNDDPFFHNVFSYSSTRRFDLGRFPQGESKSVTFDEVGVVNVFCEVHDRMRAAIVVTENAFHAVVDEDGAFRIEGVPAGEHTLAVWHPDTETLERTITVRSGATERIEVELKR